MPLGDSIHRPDLPVVTDCSQMTPTLTFTPVKLTSSTSGWRKPNVVKVLICGDGITGDELDSYFGQYGKITSRTKVNKGKPNYAYINFDTPVSAAKACTKFTIIELKGITVKVIPPRQEVNHSFDHSHFPPCEEVDHRFHRSHFKCDKLESKYAKTKLEEAFRERQGYNSVLVQENSVSGIDLWVPSEILHEATRIGEEIVKSIQEDMAVEELKLESRYIPALLNEGGILKRLDEAQAQHSFDLHVCSQASETTQMMPLKEFSEMLSVQGDELTTNSDVLANFVSSTSAAVHNKWFWENDVGLYSPYSKNVVDELNERFNDPYAYKRPIVEINSQKYAIDLNAMTQTKFYSRQTKTRRIKQMKVLSPDECQVTLQVRTIKESMTVAYDLVKQILKKSTEQVEVNKLLPHDADESLRQDLLKVTKRLFVRSEFCGKTEHAITLSGNSMYIKNVVLPQINDAILSYRERMLRNHSEKGVTEVVSSNEVPPTWSPSQEKVVELIPVQACSDEWDRIESLLHSTLPQAGIVKLERIQNKWLWDTYVRSRDRMREKNAGHVNELELFHGTSRTPPEKIYSSEKGFDFRFSDRGLWGEGAYFAKDAKYSNEFAYKIPKSDAAAIEPEHRQFFVAQVLTGLSTKLPQNRFLKKPPPLTDSQSNPGTGIITIFKEQRYDSVIGETGGSYIYVVYEHDKAYPEYLITYKL
jgi:hypothetical protein